MARYWPINVVVLVMFLAATANCAGTSGSKANPKKRTFLEKLNNLVYFDLIGALATDKLHSSVRTPELLEDRRELVATTPHPDVTTPKPDVTTPQPDVTTPQPDVTTPQPDVTTPQPDVTTPKPDVTTPQPADITTQQPDVTTQQPDVMTTPSATRPHPVVTTADIAACGDRWTKNSKSLFSFCTCTQKCSVNDARKKCEEKQAELAKCNSRELENFFVLSLNKPKFILLGGNDRDEEGTWRWPDGSLMNATYTNWRTGQPNGGTRYNCLMFYTRIPHWYDAYCDYRYPAYDAGFVCEKKHL